MIVLILGLLGSAVGLVYPSSLEVSNGVPTDLGYLIGFALPITLFVYAAYWAFTIRKGLGGWIYRNQAFGIILVSLAYLVELVGNLLTITVFANNQYLYHVSFPLRFDFLALMTFYWIDSSMRTVHDVDPLSRDTLWWSKLRYVFWALIIFSVGGTCILAAVFYQYFINPPAGALAAILSFLLIPALILVTYVPGIIGLPIGAIRSKDKYLRNQLIWFALSSFFLIVLAGVASIIPNLPDVTFLLAGFCLYRSARSLVPLNKLPAEAVERKNEI